MAPFTSIPFNTMSQQGTVSSNRMVQGRDELQEYDRRCVVLKHVVVIRFVEVVVGILDLTAVYLDVVVR